MALIKKYQIQFLIISLIVNLSIVAIFSYFAVAQTPFFYPPYKSILTGLESSSAALDLTDATAANRRFTVNTTRGWSLTAIYMTFTTAASRDITISDVRGTEVYDWSTTTGNTATTVKITPNPNLEAILPDSYDLRVQFTQTGSACSATVRVVYATELR